MVYYFNKPIFLQSLTNVSGLSTKDILRKAVEYLRYLLCNVITFLFRRLLPFFLAFERNSFLFVTSAIERYNPFHILSDSFLEKHAIEHSKTQFTFPPLCKYFPLILCSFIGLKKLIHTQIKST